MKFRWLIAFLLAGNLLQAQSLLKTTENYYRSNPFYKEFSQFLSHLLNDPTLENKKVNKRSDSLLFFMEGDYRIHRPFFFPAQRCHVILAEVQEESGDSTNSVYTYYVYQLIGYASTGESGRKDVQDEYERLVKKNRKGFDSLSARDIRTGDKVSGQITDLYFNDIQLSPMTLAWASGRENLFAISIRFLVVENRAYFPVYQNRLMQESP